MGGPRDGTAGYESSHSPDVSLRRAVAPAFPAYGATEETPSKTIKEEA